MNHSDGLNIPRVSVLMPVYNTREDHLRGAIESILNQTFSDFEFLILNDASTDENVERVVKSYHDARIKYAVNEKNLGISRTRNRLLEMARGEYLAVVDHDDVSMPDRLAEEVAWLDMHPETGIVGAMIESVYDDGEKRIIEYPENNADIEKKMLWRNCMMHPVCMIRKSVLQEHGISYEGLFSPAEDYALFCRLLGKTEFHNLQKILLYYRNHSNNTSHLQSQEMSDAAIVIQDFARRENPELWEFSRFNLFRKIRFYLFRKFPLVKIEERYNRLDFYLFSFIPLFSITREEWRER